MGLAMVKVASIKVKALRPGDNLARQDGGADGQGNMERTDA
jgi:hypothetical protein